MPQNVITTETNSKI